jgi:N-acyl-D-aspartate/D-glutamate deacylase
VFRQYLHEEKFLTLEEAIRKMTPLPASFLMTKDRGSPSKGCKADIVVFDPETVQDRADTIEPCR